jgi:hypothetical protein|tara:strand:- start:1950 stop:2144 length:195 start_codon:yes stop_codon:yes gene_type:complete
VPNVESNPISTGYFIDSAVEALTDKTDTQSGVTDLKRRLLRTMPVGGLSFLQVILLEKKSDYDC